MYSFILTCGIFIFILGQITTLKNVYVLFRFPLKMSNKPKHNTSLVYIFYFVIKMKYHMN